MSRHYVVLLNAAQQELAELKTLLREFVAAKRAAISTEIRHKQSNEGILGGPVWEQYRRAAQRLRDAEAKITTLHDSWENT